MLPKIEKKKILTAHIQAVRILCGASGRAAITLHRKKQGRKMARYRFNKKVRSNKRDENKKLDTRKIQASYNLLIISKEKESY